MERNLSAELGAPLGWDLGFLAFGALLVVVGAESRRTPQSCS